MALDSVAFTRWLDAYGRAWEGRDPDAVITLFTPTAHYHWTPFGEPLRGHGPLAEAWQTATSNQKDIQFRYEVICVHGARGIARWWCSLGRPSSARRVRIEGILWVEINEQGHCTEFREWWHSDEGAAP